MSNKKNQEAYLMKKDTKKNTNEQGLSVINEATAGIDIGASSVHVCARGRVREYSTFTNDLRAMSKWLKELKITSVAMESTGVYWIPVYDILEQDGFKALLVNAHHLKTVSGRKTDVKDCQWIQKLHSFGLLNGSFRPEGDYLVLRNYVRHRSKLFQLASAQVQLMHKALTQMNIRLGLVVSDITGQTGINIIRAIIAGERNPNTLAKMRSNQNKSTEEEIVKALEGNYREELIFELKQSLEAYDFFHTQILKCEQAIKTVIDKLERCDVQQPNVENDDNFPKKGKNGRGLQKKTNYNKSPYHFDMVSDLQEILGVDLTKIPGLGVNIILKLISEIGTDMSRWPTAKHFVSWLGLCPGNKISGGKILSSKTKPTANKAAQAFRLAAQTLYKSSTALGAFFRKMRGKFGGPKAITATAHKIARILYAMLKNRVPFEEMDQAEYERQREKRAFEFLKRKASDLGFALIEKTALPA